MVGPRACFTAWPNRSERYVQALSQFAYISSTNPIVIFFNIDKNESAYFKKFVYRYRCVELWRAGVGGSGRTPPADGRRLRQRRRLPGHQRLPLGRSPTTTGTDVHCIKLFIIFSNISAITTHHNEASKFVEAYTTDCAQTVHVWSLMDCCLFYKLILTDDEFLVIWSYC